MDDRRRRARVQCPWSLPPSLPQVYPEQSKSGFSVLGAPSLEDFISDSGERSRLFKVLMDEVEWKEKRGTFGGENFLLPRLVAWYGPLPYRYAGVTMPTRPQWLPAIQNIHDKISAETGHKFNSVLLNQYRNGRDSVAWHSDAELLMGLNPTIASVSLGDTRMFEMREKVVTGKEQDYETSQHVKIPLKDGALLIMDGSTQTYWQVKWFSK